MVPLHMWQAGVQKKGKGIAICAKVRGLSAKVHHPATVQVQYAKRTSPSSSVGKTTPNPYIIIYIWVRGAHCAIMQKDRGLFAKMQHHP